MISSIVQKEAAAKTSTINRATPGWRFRLSLELAHITGKVTQSYDPEIIARKLRPRLD
jgi:hypothetical protein